jgi:hypothetical protein
MGPVVFTAGAFACAYAICGIAAAAPIVADVLRKSRRLMGELYRDSGSGVRDSG